MDHNLIHRCCCCFFFAVALLASVSNAYGDLQFKHLTRKEQSCDLFRGQWIFSPSDPPYTEKCGFLLDRQKCLKNHRPDSAYLHWRWKPYHCELPRFDSQKFLNLMKNKVFAFIGDSISANQKNPLLCLLSKVDEPLLVHSEKFGGWDDWTDTWLFPSYNFTVLQIGSQFLLRVEDKHGERKMYPVHLDILDDHWTDMYHQFDYVVIGTGPWFESPTLMFENNTVIGCHLCQMDDVPEVGQFYAYRKALSLAFRFIIASDHKPFVIYRIHSPRHFEDGFWYTTGHCNRTLPFDESDLITNFTQDYSDQENERIGREEYTQASIAAGTASGQDKAGVHLEMLDVYHLSLLRPDGHPDVYRGFGKHDCLHWCTPGVIDTWNDLMMQMIIKKLDQSGTSLKEKAHVV